MRAKYTLGLVLTTLALDATAGPGFCDPTFTREIPPLEKTQCSSILYGIFPKMIEYKGQLLEPGALCMLHSTPSPSRLRAEYCKSGNKRGMDATGRLTGQNLDMTIEIQDIEGPEFQTKIAKAALNLELSAFEPAVASGMNFFQSSNKIFDKNKALIAMPRRNNEVYEFTALYDKRYLVKIRIHGAGRFNSPEEVDAFVLEYTKAMSFPGR